MRKWFIDGGAFNGDSVKRFLRYYPGAMEYQIIAFECNPALQKVSYPKYVIVRHEAIWTENTEMDFFVDTRQATDSQGASLFKEKITGNLDKKHPVKVHAINFSEFLRSTISQSDRLVLKLNIEGAEYPVLQHLIEQGTISLVDQLYCCWHWHKCDIPKIKHNELNKTLRAHGIRVFDGFNPPFSEK